MIKAVFCDLDGTLLHDDSGAEENYLLVPQNNAKMLHKLIDSGVKFIPCSGRSIGGVKIVVESFPHNYAVSNNGTIVYKNDRLILENFIKTSDVNKICQILIDHKISFMLDSIENRYRYGVDLLSEKYHKMALENPDLKYFSWDLLKQEKWVSFCVTTNVWHNDLDKLINKVKDLVGDDFHVMQCAGNAMNIVLQGVNKGYGVEFVLRQENWSWDEVATIGDNINDLEMLDKTINSFAMNHGGKQVKDTATYNVDSVCDVFEMILQKNDKL